MYSTVIFDVDGTLIDTEEAVLGSLQLMLKNDYGKEYTKEELTFVLGIPGADALPKLGIIDIDYANERWNHYMKQFYDSIKVFNGINQMLNSLTSLTNHNIITGIVTSKTNIELQDDFKPFGLMNHLPVVVCADDTEQHKPNPEPLLKFLQLSGADASTSFYIGDTIYDYQCARDAGIDFGLALWGCKNPEGIQAKYLLHTPLDILKLVE